ncbi:DUF4249 domain-containing protein [Pontibacter mangrovi]|uniref:DUF4249 domain-containing protein n=1 Tax=Pontibacter mangrovi TaxID=2589816 RepID=A0A501VPI8_9BACT|nr:DUF4249 domain-containing protein [Pontibacter mangrovi]TPE39579.1 DUF4249 domain-containing protein [Pontibacter mangrovi]
MKTRNLNVLLGWLMALLLNGCIEPYAPEVLEAPNSYLVVNGFINANGPTNVQLLRTQNLNEEVPPPAETGATVSIEAENGENYRLSETEAGYYTVGNLGLSPANKYRLYIKTSDGEEYLSEFVAVKQTPEVGAVTWKPIDEEVQLYVSAQDPENDTRYYRWEYESTWQFRSALFTNLKFDGDTVVYRTDSDEEIYYCWRSDHSTTIELSNSTRLSQDVISNYKLLTIPHNSEKLAIKYSILVKQYALTREAYEYWETLKKNTESIGTLFDPLPSQLKGNIRNIHNPDEPVVGFVSASTMQEKRIFIDHKELPKEWRLYLPMCTVDTLLFEDRSVKDLFQGGGLMPVFELYAPSGPFVIGYTYGAKSCVDCRTKGTNVKPAFWE